MLQSVRLSLIYGIASAATCAPPAAISDSLPPRTIPAPCPTSASPEEPVGQVCGIGRRHRVRVGGGGTQGDRLKAAIRGSGAVGFEEESA